MQLPPPFADEQAQLIHVVIETPKGSRNKFAYQEDSGLFLLKKILPSGTAFPLDFGFIPGTSGEDGDPIDVLVLMEQATYPGCLLQCRLLGVIKAEQQDKDNSVPVRNDRLIAIPDASVDFAALKKVDDIGKERLNDIIHFFKYYRMMSGGKFHHIATDDKKEALKLVKEAIL